MPTTFSSLTFLIVLFLSLTSFGQTSIKDLEIISRKQWNAEPARTAEMVRHIPTFITIHHTGTNQNLERSTQAKLKALQQFSYSEGVLGDGVTPKKPWGDVPYHYYIAADGSIAEGRENHLKATRTRITI